MWVTTPRSPSRQLADAQAVPTAQYNEHCSSAHCGQFCAAACFPLSGVGLLSSADVVVGEQNCLNQVFHYLMLAQSPVSHRPAHWCLTGRALVSVTQCGAQLYAVISWVPNQVCHLFSSDLLLLSLPYDPIQVLRELELDSFLSLPFLIQPGAKCCQAS